MKSYDLQRCVVDLYRSLLEDLSYVDRTVPTELERILNRLQSLLQSRGIAFFTIALPDVSKFLERSLDDEQLSDVRPHLCGARSKKDLRPSLFGPFWDLIFDRDGVLLASPSLAAIAGLRQLLLVLKKASLECRQEKVDETLKDFLNIDQNLSDRSLHAWTSDIPDWDAVRVDGYGHPLWGPLPIASTGHVAENLQLMLDTFGYDDVGGTRPSEIELEVANARWNWKEFRKLCAMVTLSLPSLNVWELKPKHGPGAVADDVRVKYELSHWPSKLDRMFPADWFGSHDYVDRTQTRREAPSRVLCVPKTQKGPRIIAAEPTAHQWCQGAIQRWFYRSIGGSLIGPSIDFQDQSASQALALDASASRSHGTIDLSAASDRLSADLVHYVFQVRQDILDVLHATRTRTFKMPDGTIHVAKKFACMGSACTFPVQTIVFTIISIFAILRSQGEEVTVKTVRDAAKRVRVFGDDIIIPTHAYSTAIELLTELGLAVNYHKSFGRGYFRESCGTDAYHGVDVTPAYLRQLYSDRDPESLVSVAATSNNFYMKGFYRTAAWLRNTIEPSVREHIRFASRDVSQPFFLDWDPDNSHLKTRVNPSTQSLEYKCLVVTPKDDRRTLGDWNASLLQFFCERGDRPLIDEVLLDGCNRAPERELGQPSRRPVLRQKRRWVPAIG